jgi:hypothetical protein
MSVEARMPKIELPARTYSKLADLARERGLSVDALARTLVAEALKKDRKPKSPRRPQTPEELGYRSSAHGHKPLPVPEDFLREKGPAIDGLVETLRDMRRKRA